MTTHTHKMVDGVRVPLTPGEIAEAKARDSHFENVTKPAQQAAVLRQQELIMVTKDLTNLLTRSSLGQIDAYFDGLTPEQLRPALAALAKIIALRL